MIQLGEYTKEEMADALNLNDDKASHLTDKLKKLGYKFETRGKGRTYRITITAQPQAGLKEFAEECLGISARFEDKLKHFLYLLFASGCGQFANMTPSSLEWHTYSNDETIKKWLDSLIKCGLLEEEVLVSSYYATKKECIGNVEHETGKYKYTQLWKEITLEEYEKAINAFTTNYKSYGNISKNPDIALDEALYYSNIARKEALDGWWAKRKTESFTVRVNTKHKYYSKLLSLLEDYEYVEYKETRTGNRYAEAEEMYKREERWEAEKQEKRMKLKEEQQKEEIDENLTFTQKFNKDCDEVFEDIHNFLKYIDTNYYKKGLWLYE